MVPLQTRPSGSPVFTLRYLLPALPFYGLALFVLTAFIGGAGISLYLNAEFGASRVGDLGRWIALVCDIFKIGLSAAYVYLAGWLTRLFALAGIISFSLLSILSSYGYYIQHIEADKGQYTAYKKHYFQLQEEKRRQYNELKRLGHHRPVEVIKQAIRARKQDKIYWDRKRSDQCRNATIEDSKNFCKILRNLETEYLAAKHAHPQIQNIIRQLETIEQKLKRFDLTKISQRNDPFARSFGDPDQVNVYFNIFLAILIEIATTAGLPLAIFLGTMANKKRQTTLKTLHNSVRQTIQTVSPEQEQIWLDDPDGLIAFLNTLHKDKTGFVASVDLLRAYKNWLQTHIVLTPLNEKTLGERMIALGYQRVRRRKQGGGRATGYTGLSLQ